MDVQQDPENLGGPKLSLHRIYQKNSSFESFSMTVDSLKNPVSPVLDMQVCANAYAQENNIHHAVLGLKIEAKHNGDSVWRLQLETAGFYTLEGFGEEQEKDILHGYCMNQLYSHAAVIVTQIVTQGGFAPIYLQPMDFNHMSADLAAVLGNIRVRRSVVPPVQAQQPPAPVAVQRPVVPPVQVQQPPAPVVVPQRGRSGRNGF